VWRSTLDFCLCGQRSLRTRCQGRCRKKSAYIKTVQTRIRPGFQGYSIRNQLIPSRSARDLKEQRGVPATQPARRAIWPIQFHWQLLRIYKFGFNQDYYTSALILLQKIVVCGKFHCTQFRNYECFHLKFDSKVAAPSVSMRCLVRMRRYCERQWLQSLVFSAILGGIKYN